MSPADSESPHGGSPAESRLKGPWRRFGLFGFAVASDFPFEGPFADPPFRDADPDVHFSCSLAAPREVAWESLEPLYSSPFATEEGESVARLFRVGEGEQTLDVLRFAKALDFYLTEDRIEAHLLDPDLLFLVQIRLLGPVLAYWLERRELVSLHASAVVVNGRAAAFLATHGGGKTSLAASLLEQGHALLTDDILPLEPRGDRVLGRPGYPQMRMWPDQAERFLGRSKNLGKVHPHYEKLRVPVGGEEGLGRFETEPRPMACIYLPERRPPGEGGDEVTIRELSKRDSVIELLRHAFVSALTERKDWQPRRLALLARAAGRISFKRLSYPSGYEKLSRVADAIAADLA